MGKYSTDGNFAQKISTGKVLLFNNDMMATLSGKEDVRVPLSDKDKELQSFINLYICMNLDEDAYVIWQLRKKGYTLQQIGDVFDLKRNTILYRLRSAEDKINKLADDISKYRDANERIREISEQLDAN